MLHVRTKECCSALWRNLDGRDRCDHLAGPSPVCCGTESHSRRPQTLRQAHPMPSLFWESTSCVPSPRSTSESVARMRCSRPAELRRLNRGIWVNAKDTSKQAVDLISTERPAVQLPGPGTRTSPASTARSTPGKSQYFKVSSVEDTSAADKLLSIYPNSASKAQVHARSDPLFCLLQKHYMP